MSDFKYGYAKTLARPCVEDALGLVWSALLAEGFEVVSELDLGLTLKKELGVDVRRYLILVACKLSLVHQALGHDPHAGLHVLCQVVVQESKDDGRVVVSIVDPMSSVVVAANPALASLANDADQCIRRIIRSLN